MREQPCGQHDGFDAECRACEVGTLQAENDRLRMRLALLSDAVFKAHPLSVEEYEAAGQVNVASLRRLALNGSQA